MIINFQQGLSYLQNYLHGLQYTVSLLVLLALALALCFAGRALIKGLAFIIVGIVLASVGAAIGMAYLGTVGLLLGAAVGFIVGGFLGLMVVILGVGIAVGYLGYSASTALMGSETISIIVGVVLFFVGIVLADKLLSVATAVVGGLLFFNVMTALGFEFLLAAIAAIVVGGLGVAVQLADESREKTRRMTKTTTQTIQNGGQSTTVQTTESGTT